jgi:hypothetical protein
MNVPEPSSGPHLIAEGKRVRFSEDAFKHSSLLKRLRDDTAEDAMPVPLPLAYDAACEWGADPGATRARVRPGPTSLKRCGGAYEVRCCDGMVYRPTTWCNSKACSPHRKMHVSWPDGVQFLHRKW